MKLFFILILVLSTEAFAQWRLPKFNRNDDSYGGLRAVWSCPTQNRGDMPDEREVEIVYDDYGRASFRPDVFRTSANPLRALRNLFGRKKSSRDVGECLRSFMTSLPAAVGQYQQTQCNGSDAPVCTRAPNDVTLDAGRTIRESSFYRKYRSDLTVAEDLLPQPQIPVSPNPEMTPTESTELQDEPAETTTLKSETQPVERATRSQGDARDRARLLDYLVDNYSRVGDVQEFTKFCPDLGHTAGVNSAYCRDRFNRNQGFLNNLSRMFTEIRGEPVGVTRVLQSIECLPPRSNDFRDVEDLLHSLDRRADCDPLPEVGDYKLFRKAQGGSTDWYTSGNYLLKKTGDDSYEATLNLNFKNAGGAFSSDQMMEHVRNCLSQANPYLRGPGGKKLSIKTLSPQETIDQLPASERPFPGDINILPDQVRLANGVMATNEINSGNFHSKIDCATVTHEILHHLGLCDEYKETRTNIVPGLTRSRSEEWSCRVVPKAPSIMKNHVEAYNESVPQQFSCQCSGESCRSLLRGQDAKSVSLKKMFLTATPYDILGSHASACSNPTYLSSLETVPEADKAYVDVRLSSGRLSFQHRMLFMDGARVVVGRKNVVCNCPAGDSSCEYALKRAAEVMPTNPGAVGCPYGTVAGQKSVATPGAQNSAQDGTVTVITQPRKDSLLSPSQFDKILTGSCKTSPSSLFKRCSEFAYTPQDSVACGQKPKECADDDQFFGVSAQ